MKHHRSLAYIICAMMAIVLSMVSAGAANIAQANQQIGVQRNSRLLHSTHQYHTTLPSLIHANQLHTTLTPVRRNLVILRSRTFDPPDQYHHANPFQLRIMAYRSHHERPRLKPTAVHIVESGDTLWDLSITFHTSVSALMNANHLHSTIIYPGQRLHFMVVPNNTPTDSRRQLGAAVNLSIYAQKGIPVQFIPVYQAAGRAYGVPWTVLAAIHYTETNFATGSEMSPAGAQGPMQFMPTTFAYYEVSAPGPRHLPSIDNVNDAIYTCAHMLAADGYASNPRAALYLYNHSNAYVDSIDQLVQRYAES